MELGGLVQTLFPKKIDKQDNFTVSKMSSNVAISESDWYNYTSGFDFDSLARGQSRFFKPENFETKLTETQKNSAEYKSWAKANITDSGHDYDYNAAFTVGNSRGEDSRGHLSDIGKKPNHPTFSVASTHATGKYKAIAGSWKNENYVPSKKTLSAVNRWRVSQGKEILYGSVR